MKADMRNALVFPLAPLFNIHAHRLAVHSEHYEIAAVRNIKIFAAFKIRLSMLRDFNLPDAFFPEHLRKQQARRKAQQLVVFILQAAELLVTPRGKVALRIFT